MKKFFYIFISIWLCLGSTVLSQNPEWITYNTSNSGLPSNWINSLAIDGSGNKWIGSGNGLAKFDGTNWTVYDTSNSDLPYDWIVSLTIDGSDNKWITVDNGSRGGPLTGGGLIKFDDNTTTIFDESNSGLPSNTVSCIEIDNFDNKWIGTMLDGLAKFDGTNWTVYDVSNSGLPTNAIGCIALDDFGNKWIGTWGGGLVKFDDTNWIVYNTSNYINPIAIDESSNVWIGTGDWFDISGFVRSGLAKFDGTNWIVYNTTNSGLPDNYINFIAIDGSSNKWIGTYGNGLAKFDGTNWTIYNTSNSGLSDNWITSIAIDRSGNKWIGTGDWMGGGGLAVYNEGGIVSVEEKTEETNKIPTNYVLHQNYPNPFNPSTTINYSIPKQSTVTLKVYDLLGKEGATLVNEYKPAGKYETEFDGASFPSGVYFYKIVAKDFVSTKKMILLR